MNTYDDHDQPLPDEILSALMAERCPVTALNYWHCSRTPHNDNLHYFVRN